MKCKGIRISDYYENRLVEIKNIIGGTQSSVIRTAIDRLYESVVKIENRNSAVDRMRTELASVCSELETDVDSERRIWLVNSMVRLKHELRKLGEDF